MDKKIIDLEDVLKTWAWTYYTKTKEGKVEKYEQVQIDVIWDKVHFTFGNPEFEEKKHPQELQSKVLFSSTFDNNTDQFQQHNFQTSRTTLATATTTLTKGFTRGLNSGIRLLVPNEVQKVTAGFGNYINIDCREQNTVERSLTWTVKNTVNVPKQSTMIAELELLEGKFQASFVMNVSFYGRVNVRISDPVSGRLLMAVHNDIATVLRDQKIHPQYSKPSSKTVVCKVAGTVNFHYGVSQRVRVRKVKKEEKVVEEKHEEEEEVVEEDVDDDDDDEEEED